MAWSAGTKGAVRGKAVLAPKDKKELDEAKAKGTLAGAWVLIAAMPGPGRGRGPTRPSAASLRKELEDAKVAGIVIRLAQRVCWCTSGAAPDLLGQAADPPLGDPPAQAVRRDRRLAQGRQDGHARVRHPQLLQEGADQALQRDRRHPRHREARRVRDRRRPHRLLGRRHRRDRQRHGRRHDAGGRAHPDEGRREAEADDPVHALERRGAGPARLGRLRQGPQGPDAQDLGRAGARRRHQLPLRHRRDRGDAAATSNRSSPRSRSWTRTTRSRCGRSPA